MEFLERINRARIRLSQIKKETGKGNFSILRDYYSLHHQIQISFYEYYNFELERQPKLAPQQNLIVVKRTCLLKTGRNKSQTRFNAKIKAGY